MRQLRSFIAFVLFYGFGCFTVAGQINPDIIREFLRSSKMNSYDLNSVTRVRQFYEARQFRPAWVDNPAACTQLQLVVNVSADYFLNANDYQPQLMRSLRENAWPINREDSLQTEVRLTDAAIHLFSDIAYGNAVPEISYNGLAYDPNCHNIPELLADAIDSGTLASLPALVEPSSIEYSAVKKMIRSYQVMEQMPAFADVLVTSSAVNTGNSALIKRLYQLSIIDSVPAQISVTTLRNKIRDVQRLFNLLEDGLLRTTVLQELNVPLRVRISELKITLNTIRWLNCIKSAGSVIVVNIPSASLLVYENGHVILESKVIVGKKTTRTPTLTSKVTEVVLYPYWMVPKSIATKELLPLIKKNPGYLNLNNMQVLDARGKVMNPADIDWNALSTNYFPYVLRQSTGCDNSLGLVKLNFYNPYNVYLHDTPWKVLFAANKRYFSHGCMRVEKAIELAHLLLEGNTMAVDSLEEKGCLINQSPVAVPASLQMPVFVLYNTAWIDSSANVRFDEDIYNRFQHLRKKPGALTNVVQIDDRSQRHLKDGVSNMQSISLQIQVLMP